MVTRARGQKQGVKPKPVKRPAPKAAVRKRAPVRKKAPVARRQQNVATRSQQKKPAWSVTLTPRILNVLSVGAVFLVLLGGGMWLSTWLNNPENLLIEKVEWKGDVNHLTQTELDTLIEPYTATNLYLLDASMLEQTLEAHPWVRSVSLHKVWPEQLIINLEEQFPVAFWGQKHLLNQFGEVFEGELPAKAEIFPTIFSPIEKGRAMAERYVELMQMLDGLGLEIVELTEDESGSWRMKFRQGQEIILGRKEQKKRVKRFRVGYMQELSAKFEDIRRVDLRYTNGFAVEWKQGSGHAGAVGSPGIMMPERLGS
ncbi:MAG: Cell division protein FtsQ [uncultured Thiotrichaceae bacterium]|uniref:Cell division protein FtsQ n=1 Tax=uncultured Thiotrichaceae bacterium TaxID=298394 RepID=A0A6S6SW46_9GAMM|nr:MAG: Cell division protein FtsQ [uncultured Thiotrichaceae bacterium]